jgi:TRAP-type C4-dicarboxylate transport system permease small subunit
MGMRAIRQVSRVLAWVAGALMLLSALLIGADVLLRNALRIAPFHSFELSRYGFAAALGLGLAFTLTERANIRIDILHRLVPRRAHPWLDVLALLALAPVALAFAWYACDVMLQSARLGAVSNTPMAVPLVIPQSIWAAGLSWFALVACVMALQALWALLRGRAERVEEIGGMPGLAAEGLPAVEPKA